MRRRLNNANRPLRIVLIGWGAIAQRIAQLLEERGPETSRIVAVATRASTEPRVGLPAGVQLIHDPSQLVAGMADLVVEAASREAVAEWGEAAINAAPRFVIASTSALADDDLAARLVAWADRANSQIVVPPGALAGIDALAAAGVLDLASVTHRIIKPAKAWRGTEAETLCSLDDLVEPAEFCQGSAREIARRFPKNANVAIISAMAGLGLDQTQTRLVADPGATRNAHHIIAEGAFGRLEAKVENMPLASNPKSSELTALSLFNAIRREGARLSI